MAHGTATVVDVVEGGRSHLRQELARRMPALNATVIALGRGHSVNLATAIRDAHALASSSAMFGEAAAAAALRQVEESLASPDAERDVPALAEHLTRAWVALSAWLPGR